METSSPITWWGNILEETPNDDIYKTILGVSVDEIGQQEHELNDYVGLVAEQFRSRNGSYKKVKQPRREKDQERQRHLIKHAWKRDAALLSQEQPTDMAHVEFRFDGRQYTPLDEFVQKRQRLYGKCSPQILERLAEIEPLLTTDPNRDQKLLDYFERFHREEIEHNTSPLSLPSIFMFTVDDHESITTKPLPPENNISMYVFFIQFS